MKKENLKCIITIGPPGSGKTTWANEHVRKNENFVRISRDDFRYMLKNHHQLDIKGETMITELVLLTAKMALEKRYNIIIDATNLIKERNEFYITELNELCDIEFILFDLSKKKCIERNLQRNKPVAEHIINEMFKDFEILKDSFDFKSHKKQPRIISYYPHKPELVNAIIVDIDGTLAHANNKRDMYDEELVYKDDVDEIIKRMVIKYSKEYKIIIITGRRETYRKITEDWLNLYEIPYDFLFMRGSDDFRKDFIIKKEIYNNQIINIFNIEFVLDDRNSVVKMWRTLGLKVLQVNEGGF